MTSDDILRGALRDPAVIAASFASNLLGLAIPLAMIQIYDRIIPNRAFETLTVLGFIVFTAIVAELALRLSRQYLLCLAGEKFEVAAYGAALTAMMTEPPMQGSELRQGTLFTRITSIDRLRDIYSGPSITGMLDLPFAGLFLMVILLISPVAGLSVLVLLALSFLILRARRRKVLDLQLDRQGIEAQRHSFLAEVLRGMEAVRALRIEPFMRRRYERLLARSAVKSAQMAAAVQVGQGFAAAVGTLAPLFICCMGAFFVIKDDMTVGSLAAIVLLTGRVVQPVLQVEAFLAGAENAKQARSDLHFVIDRSRRETGQEPLRRIEKIELKDLSTEPEPATQVSFEGLNLSLRAGECVVLDAPSATHKSAFLRLLAGETAVRDGEYLINGRPARGYRQQDRLTSVRLLTSENRLLEGTLMENLSNFQPGLYRDKAVELAARIGIDQFISRSVDGYQMKVGSADQGRLPPSIADAALIVCAMVTDPDVILFDEANASLDLETDRKLLAMLAGARSNAIIVLVSSRPSYLRLATRRLDLTPHIRMRASGMPDTAAA